MKTAQICNRSVVTAPASMPVMELALLMRKHHVGTVVVVEGGETRKPVGIITDRDIVLEVVAAGLDSRTLAAGEIMSAVVVTASGDDDASWSLKVMRDHGIRRLPVVDATGGIVGIIALDDMLNAYSSTLQDVVQAIGTERLVETTHRN